MTSASDEKWRPFNCFFSPGNGGGGPDPENRVDDKEIGSPGRPVSSRLQVPGERGHCRARTRPLSCFPGSFFLQNALQLHQQLWVTLRVVNLALWKIINEEDAILFPKKSRRELSQRIFALWIFWDGLSRYAATPLIVALSPGHSDITRCRPW